jgi:hypothetical protein
VDLTQPEIRQILNLNLPLHAEAFPGFSRQLKNRLFLSLKKNPESALNKGIFRAKLEAI